MLSKLFPQMNVGDVHFDNRNIQRCDGVPNGVRVVSICRGIKNDPLIFFRLRRLQGVYDRPFMIRLEKSKPNLRESFPDLIFDIFQRLASINFGLTCAEQVEIGSVDNEYIH